MRFVRIIIFAVVALAIAKPVPHRKASGIAIPLARHPSFPNSSKSIDLGTISSHSIAIREKILRGIDKYEINTGMMHPLAVKRSESRLGTRGGSVPLTIYQDDIWIWMGDISIGTPPQTLKVSIDTGAPDMWVLQTGCEGISGNRKLWDPHASESSKKQESSFRLGYADESVAGGDIYTDNVTVAGFTADPQTFGSASSYTGPMQIDGHAIGVLGLAFPAISGFGANPLFESLVGQHRLIDQRFSLKLSSSGAEMYVGGENKMLYRGDITYARVTDPGFWLVSMEDVRVNGHKILLNVPAILDTGANYIHGDWKRVSELYAHLHGTLIDYGSLGYYYLPCDSFPTVSFTFGGRTFEIPPERLRLQPLKEGSSDCFSAIVAERSSVEFWSIGNAFLQGVYSVFDYGGLQVGFADLA